MSEPVTPPEYPPEYRPETLPDEGLQGAHDASAPADGGPLPDGWEAEAAEYVLGVLPEAQLDRFEARLARDPDLQQDVLAWTEYFSTFTDTLPEIEPPAGLWRQIEAEALGPPPPPIWRQVLPYLVGAVVGVTLSWAVFLSGVLAPGGAELSGALVSGNGAEVFSARFDPVTRVLAVTPNGPFGAEALELWMRPAAGAEPVSLGPLGPDGVMLGLPPFLAERMGEAVLDVSLAPQPGAAATGEGGFSGANAQGALRASGGLR